MLCRHSRLDRAFHRPSQKSGGLALVGRRRLYLAGLWGRCGLASIVSGNLGWSFINLHARSSTLPRWRGDLAVGNSIYLNVSLLERWARPKPLQSSLTATSTLLERDLAERRGLRFQLLWARVTSLPQKWCGPAAIAEFLDRRRRMPESILKTRAIGAGPNHRRDVDGIRAHE